MQFLFKKSLFFLLTALLTACSGTLNQSSQNNNNFPNSPYGKFQRERASLEPIIETSSVIAQTQESKVITQDSQVSLSQVRPLELSGDLEIGGSGGVLPLNKLIYDRFVDLGYSGTINLSTIGTTESINLFCQGEKFDLLTLARPMTELEIAACQAKGIEPVSFEIGKDAIAIVVSRQNNFLNRVTLPMLADILTQEKWSDINPNFPDQPIERLPVGPGPSMDIVVDKVLEGNSSPLLNASNTTLYWYEQPMIQRLSNNQYGISLLSYPVFKEATNSLKSVVVEGTTPESVELANQTYPFERSLYIYVDRKQLKTTTKINSFINFYLSHVNDKIKDAGLFPLSTEELDRSKTQFLQVMRSE